MKKTAKKKSKKKLAGGGNKKGHRRYKVGKYPAYDNALNQAVEGSSVLNPAQRGSSIYNYFVLTNPKALLLEIEGVPEQDHHFRNPNSGQWFPAMIPKYLNELKSINARFKNWQKLQVKEGRALEPPKQMPKELADLKHKYEALLDCRRREAEKARSIIDEKEAKKAEKKKKDILKYGCAMIPDNLRADIRENNPSFDGQKISYKDGIPFIDCPESPYHKMPLFHYKKMAESWKAEYREKVLSEWEKIEGKGSFKHKKSGKILTGIAHAGLRRPVNWNVKKSDLPPWPKNAKPIDKLK